MTYLTTVLQAFFTDYAHTQRSLSPNTITSYRDTWKIFIKHSAATTHQGADRLLLEHITRDVITGFLYYLEHERGNAPATRNQRLTAIRAVMAHALPDYPEHADHIRQILAIPQAKTPKQRLHHLTEPETKALLEAPNTTTWVGRRDQALLTLAISTGLRISEIISLTTKSVHLTDAANVECEGKGRKHRATPIDPKTTILMREYLKERHTRPGAALFPGPKGKPLSRDAIESRLRTHLKTAQEHSPTLPGKHITFHCLRHTCAMNLLNAGVDITVIALWLGHEQTTTTDIYLHQSMKTKYEAMERTRPPNTKPGTYKPDPDILTWLNAL